MSFSISPLEASARIANIDGCADDDVEMLSTVDETLISPEEAYLNSFGGKQIHSYREELGLSVESGVSVAAIPETSDYFKVINVEVVTQEKGHFCGPATVIQNMEYLSGGAFNKTQQQVYTGMGNDENSTDGSSSEQMRNYMNAQLDTYDYSDYRYYGIDIKAASFTETFYVDAIYSCIRYFNWPAFGAFVLDDEETDGDTTFVWPYSTEGSGHFLSYSGIEIAPTYNDIRFTDSKFLREFPQSHAQTGWYFVRSSICMRTILSLNC